ncbi:hypothetical protein [Marinomonas algarum]|uniref:Tetratricopeptide repeat-containing protein n=1 Tax=Marinomonas algarum TaxID=2883105 RepID=A0A9X1ILK3_9GAMM|nr:hypothetical protein [Marinomonas algarum]MCB5160491.1 hypothetical protein [Marinomonas algarum]
MDYWKHLIVKANQAFTATDYSGSISLYEQAADAAQKQVTHWYDTKTALTALVISKLNLAEAQCRMDQFEEAIETYATLSDQLRQFQDSFSSENPIVGHVAQALNIVKQEFLNLTKTYAYDIVKITQQKQNQVTFIGVS